MHLGGLWGVGLCLSAMGLLNLVLVACVVQKKFGYRIRSSVFRNIGLQLPWLVLAYATTFVQNLSIYCLVGLVLVGISSYLSVGALRMKTKR